jgi:mono/diheme cytochrome c family protein
MIAKTTRRMTLAGLVALAVTPPPCPAADPLPTKATTPAALEKAFDTSVRPFLEAHCASCHGDKKPKGDLDLSPFTSVEAVAKDHRRWALVLERLKAGDMPPEGARSQPTKELRKQVIEWAEAVRAAEGEKHAGDPGPVPARRLSNAEYDHTVRDLTGVDVRPARDFPVDPANEAGFDNSAESLATSPALVKKYLEAARRVADHLALTADGFAFAPHPVVTDTDRDKFCVNRIVAFYKRQRTDSADYFLAAWRYRHRAALGKPNAALSDFAADAGISPKYLATVWGVLTEKPEEVGPVAAVQALWEELPAADQPAAARAGCVKMRDFVADLRAKLVPQVKNLTSPRVHNGSQPLVLWKNREMAANRTRYAGGALAVKGLKLPPDSAAARAMTAPANPDAAKTYEATFPRFCGTFPDAFYVSERARVYLDQEKEKQLGGRLLSAGFHSQMGYFRDDGPLCELVLDAAGRKELDRLWRDLDLVANAPARQYAGFLWFDRTDSNFMRDPQFDPFRPEDRDCTSDEKVRKLAEVYLAKAEKAGAGETARTAIGDYFRGMRETFRDVEKARTAAEPTHLAALAEFVGRAYRRPLTVAEKDALTAFYRTLRDREGLGHEDAVRDCVVSVLVSPHFLFRVDLPGKGTGETVPLSDHALASRLSYFLWASMPDRELLDLAAKGDLHKPDVLLAQVKRMLRDPKARGLATEFAGHWLDFRRFEEHNAVDRTRFPAFDNALRQAMFEEPVRFVTDLAARDGSVLDLLYADHTFVNKPLAKHYGIPFTGTGDEWVRVDVGKDGRGGVLPMAVFLTKNAPGLRTSPVKRGYWVARRVLGEHIPPPPPDVPDLPADESKGERPLRDALARHREHKSCAGCHQRFDSLGLVFEGYGPVGERRAKDLGGRPIDATATFPGGTDGDGIGGLKAYIREHRQQDFVANLCRKLLAYALGRTLLPSDEKLLREMRVKLEKNEYRVSVFVDAIVTSPQFLNQRGPAASK